MRPTALQQWRGLEEDRYFVGKPSNKLTVQEQYANQFILPQHWHTQKGAHTPKFDSGDGGH
jgi:hypothetical protein